MRQLRWGNIAAVDPLEYTCGHCGRAVGSDKGYNGSNQASGVVEKRVLICPNCSSPTFFDAASRQIPGVLFGQAVADVTDAGVDELYNEARKAAGAGSFTAAVMCCRKLLMHVAVSKGAGQHLAFVEYVNYLAEKGYVSPDARAWVDHIRTTGNEANHEIRIMSRDDAEDLLVFSEMLLKIIYEYPALIVKRTKTTS